MFFNDPHAIASWSVSTAAPLGTIIRVEPQSISSTISTSRCSMMASEKSNSVELNLPSTIRR